jgi:hypothetical protein
MGKLQTFFFAELEDIAPIIRDLEQEFDIKYALGGYNDEPGVKYYKSLLDVAGLGFVTRSSWMDTEYYLIIPDKSIIKVREISLYAGGYNYAIDQEENPVSAAVNVGGIYKEGVIVASKLGTSSTRPFSLEVFNFLSKKIKKKFRRIEEFYVGKKAEEKLDAGWRLVANYDEESTVYDLRKGRR